MRQEQASVALLNEIAGKQALSLYEQMAYELKLMGSRNTAIIFPYRSQCCSLCSQSTNFLTWFPFIACVSLLEDGSLLSCSVLFTDKVYCYANKKTQKNMTVLLTCKESP